MLFVVTKLQTHSISLFPFGCFYFIVLVAGYISLTLLVDTRCQYWLKYLPCISQTWICWSRKSTEVLDSHNSSFLPSISDQDAFILLMISKIKLYIEVKDMLGTQQYTAFLLCPVSSWFLLIDIPCPLSMSIFVRIATEVVF